MTARDYQQAIARIPVLYQTLGGVYGYYDAILTPSAAGQAPRDLSVTGDPAFCTLWTLLGMPAITLPLLRGADGMPIGVQLVGERGHDGRLLRTARWLSEFVESQD